MYLEGDAQFVILRGMRGAIRRVNQSKKSLEGQFKNFVASHYAVDD